MKINFRKIEELYGNDILNLVVLNKDNILENLMYFYSLGFEDPIDLFERIPYVFTSDSLIFKKKTNLLINKLGDNYIDLIEEDISLLEQLYD